MNIIITGSTGFVGTNLSQYFEDNHYKVHRLSLRGDWSSLPDAHGLIHLAGRAHDTGSTCEAEEYYRINTHLTVRLFDDFLSSDIRDFFYFSSVKAAADSVEGELDEEYTPNPKTPYGQSKLMAEEYILSKPLPDNKRVYIIRPCMIHGPGNQGNLNLLYKVVEKGIPWPLAAFENKRSFLSIDNLNFLIDRMIHTDIPSGIYNFADDGYLSTNDLVQTIGKTIGKKALLLKIPTSMVSFAATIGDKLGLPLTTERLKKLTENYIVSNRKIKETLAVSDLPYSIEESLEKTIKSFQK
ncbi:UDP-glucose 4-epimerase [Flavobacteriaceae bacterium 3519-10]|nr:UDP-glucose 4-epimerase [Flavobacteriaceae bacterium 3519-10]